MNRPAIYILLACCLALTAENIYFATVMAKQRQTIQQYMGLQHGEHDGSAMPEPEGKPGLYLSPERTQKSI
jgi:hypothetical protein